MAVSLVTGAGGFIGQHLLRALNEANQETVALDLPGRLPYSELGAGGALEVDICNRNELRRGLLLKKPQRIYHLAGLVSSRSLEDLFTSNVLGTLNLLGLLAELGLTETRVLISGSAAEYGFVEARQEAVAEEHPIRPVSLYGLSKAMQGLLAQGFILANHLQIARTRAFNVSGPGEPPSQVCSAIARQIAQIEAGLLPPKLLVGNLDTERDFLDVRDLARGLIAVMDRGVPGKIYNVCSGSGMPIRRLLNMLLELAESRIEVQIDASLVQDDDVKRVVGDPTRVREDTGWRPRIEMGQTLADLLAYWRKTICP